MHLRLKQRLPQLRLRLRKIPLLRRHLRQRLRPL